MKITDHFDSKVSPSGIVLDFVIYVAADADTDNREKHKHNTRITANIFFVFIEIPPFYFGR